MSDANLATCRYCGRPIRWLKTEAGRPVPVEAHTATDRDTLFQTARGHMGHRNFCTGVQRPTRRRAS